MSGLQFLFMIQSHGIDWKGRGEVTVSWWGAALLIAARDAVKGLRQKLQRRWGIGVRSQSRRI